jgi:hypothetical protein
MIYSPWVNTPFEMVDFSEFLPFLRQNASSAQQFHEFVQYYASQGRLNLLSYVFLIWKWSLFGWNEAGWQIARSFQMLSLIGAVHLLLRRLGATRGGSIAGAALFIVAQTASPAWIRLTMGEPFGLLAIVGASLMATRYQAARRWRGYGVAIAVLLTASILAKEMLAVFAPFVLLLACSWNVCGELAPPRLSERNVWALAMVAGGVLAVLLPVAILALDARPGAYASDYAIASISLDNFIHSLVVILLPLPTMQIGKASLAHLAGNAIFFAIIAVGLALAQADRALRRHWQPLAIGALLLVLVGVLAYLPWPYFQDFYGLPFLVGPAILLAIAITSIEKARPAWRWLAYAGCVVIFGQGAIYSAYGARSAIATRIVNGALVEDIVKHSSADSIVVVMQVRPPSAQAWQGRGPTLARYANALLPGRRIPSIHEESCPAAQAILDKGVGNAILVSYSSSCGVLPTSTRTIRYDYTYRGWPSLARRPDSLVISILGPESVQVDSAPSASANTGTNQVYRLDSRSVPARR